MAEERVASEGKLPKLNSKDELKAALDMIIKYSAEIDTILERDLYNVNFMEVADVLNDGTLVLDENGTIVNCNRKFTELTGFTKEELLGKSCYEWNKDSKYFDNAIIGQIMKGKPQQNLYSDTLVKDRMHQLFGVPFVGYDGQIRGMALSIRDTTELINQQLKMEELQREKEQSEVELQKLRELNQQLGITGQSKQILDLKERIVNVAGVDATILITGETGCGKEVVARSIYQYSQRKDGPYIRVNCAAIPEQLIESELFGYEKGAFTGAGDKGKKGMFELADGGTILLDEVGELPLSLQPKLLRVLQEHEVMRVGGTKTIPLDVRVIAATNQDLKQMVKEKRFREDLYYRLNVVPLRVPPLRERKTDILLIAKEFLEKFNTMYHKNTWLSVPAIKHLEQYDWPGNVRELENVIERMVLMSCKDVIDYELVDEMIEIESGTESAAEAASLDEAVERLERNMITQALAEYGSTYRAAEALGITQSRIVRKMKSLGIESSKKE